MSTEKRKSKKETAKAAAEEKKAVYGPSVLALAQGELKISTKISNLPDRFKISADKARLEFNECMNRQGPDCLLIRQSDQVWFTIYRKTKEATEHRVVYNRNGVKPVEMTGCTIKDVFVIKGPDRFDMRIVCEEPASPEKRKAEEETAPQAEKKAKESEEEEEEEEEEEKEEEKEEGEEDSGEDSDGSSNWSDFWNNSTHTYWDRLKTVYKRAKDFKAKQFPLVKAAITKIDDFEVPWNKTLNVTRERNCTSDDCHPDNRYPVWAFELLSCFTNDGHIDCSVNVTYEPIEGVVYLHADRSCEAKFRVRNSNWFYKLKEKLTEMHDAGNGLTVKDPRE